MSPVPDLTIDALTARPVRRASLLLALRPGPEIAVVLRDADDGSFVQVPGLPADPQARLLGLAPAGDRLILLAEHEGRRFGGLCLHTLATGEQRWLSAHVDGQDWLAALSPDGRTMATLATADSEDIAFVNVVDIASGQRRRLATVPGGYAAESAVSWSPDSRLIAATYLTHQEEDATLVIEANGAPVGHFSDAAMLSGSNGTWITAESLACLNSACELTAIDVRRGARRPLAAASPPPLAIVGDRFVQQLPEPPDDAIHFVTLDLDGGDQRPYLTIRPACHLETFGHAPARRLESPPQRHDAPIR